MIIYNDKLFLEHATLKKFSLHDINHKREIKTVYEQVKF